MSSKIAIIDDGINSKYINAECFNYEIRNGSICESCEAVGITHGTIIADIIDKKCNDCDIISIRLMNSYKNNAKVNDLLIALEWCYNHDIKIIHLSIGSIKFYDRKAIYKIINRLSSKEVIIIAACSNKNVITYPASFNNVIGVKYDVLNTLQEDEYVYIDEPIDGIDIIAGCTHFSCGVAITPSNSYAAPTITALVAKYINKQNVNNIKKILKLTANSKSIYYYHNDYTRLINTKKNLDFLMLHFVNCTINNKKQLLLKFIENFLHNGYNCVALTSDYSDIASNIFKFKYSNELSQYEIIRIIAGMTHPGIMIIYYEPDKARDISLEKFVDMTIYYNFQNAVISYTNESNDKQIINLTYKDNSISQNLKTIFSEILSIYGYRD